MPSTYSPLLRLELLGAGEQSGLWGDTTNKNIGQLLEQAIAGVTTVSLSGGAGDYTLSALDGTFDESRSAVLKFIGNPSGIKNIIIPTETKLYVVRNDCGQTITVKTSAQVTGVTLLNGEASLVFCDGTNAVAGIATAGVGTLTVSAGGTGATSFTAGFVKSPGGTGVLTSSAAVNAATELTGTVPLANGGTGVASFTAGALVVGNGSSPLAVLTGGASGQVATWNGSSWTAATPAVGAVSSVFGRSGAVTAQSGDYSSFYPSLTGSGASGTWSININGNAASATTASSATTAGSATTASSASSVPWSGITSKPTTLSGFGITDGVTTGTTQTISGNKTFSGTITSTAYNMASFVSMYGNTSAINFSVSGSSINNVMNISSAGNLTISGNTAVKSAGDVWVNPSDRRLKKNIVSYTKGLTELVQIQPKSFEFNGKGGSTDGLKSIGIIADEIELILPDTVETHKTLLNSSDEVKTDIKYFDGSELTWLMVNAIKELKVEIDSLKAQLAAK